jgi:hypothetical protein
MFTPEHKLTKAQLTSGFLHDATEYQQVRNLLTKKMRAEF